MTKRLTIAIASCLVLTISAFAARTETTGKGPAPEATNPAPSRELNQTDRQNAMPPGKDTGPDTQAPSSTRDSMRRGTGADRQGEQGSGTSGTAAHGANPAKPAR